MSASSESSCELQLATHPARTCKGHASANDAQSEDACIYLVGKLQHFHNEHKEGLQLVQVCGFVNAAAV